MQARQESAHSIDGRRSVRQIWMAGMIWLAVACLASGCISAQYRYGTDRVGSTEPLGSSSSSLTILDGEPPPRLARLEKFMQKPRDAIRKLRGRPPVDPEEERAQRSAAVALSEEYLRVNGLDDLYIDVRTYDPREQWQRLRANERIHPLVRYTGGSLSWLRYTLLPGPLFRSDQFDPFTNTLSLNSADPAEMIFESARAKEFRRERWLGPGAYAMIQMVPLVPLVHESRAASDALTYSKHHMEGRLLDQLYPLTYSQIGSSVVSESLSVFTLSPGTPFIVRPLLISTGNLTGHSVGRWLAPDQPQTADAESQERLR